MKIVFLDVDGVLNCGTTEDAIGSYLGVDDEKVGLLERIVRSANAQIVLTSTWKKYWYREAGKKCFQDAFADRLDQALAARGLCVLDKTEDKTVFGLDRGEGILRWLKGREVGAFVILDDCLFDFAKTGLTARLVQTDGELGLTEENVARAVELLGGSEP